MSDKSRCPGTVADKEYKAAQRAKNHEMTKMVECMENKQMTEKTIGCDQVAWLLDVAERYIRKTQGPSVGRQNEMKRLAMVYEIMEVTGLSFQDMPALNNAMPQFLKHRISELEK